MTNVENVLASTIDYRARAREARGAAAITQFPAVRIHLLKLAALWQDISDAVDLVKLENSEKVPQLSQNAPLTALSLPS
jgi:hypothetical protein